MSTIIFPPALKKGDEIRIVAPASAVKKDYVNKTVEVISGLGYQVSLGKHIFSRFNQFAGTDEERRFDFQEALNDENVKAIFCARGGYGSLRIIRSIDFSLFKYKPKWIIGFSDITVFHTVINQSFHTATMHAPMPINVDSPYFNTNLKQLNLLLSGVINDIKIPYHPLNRKGLCEGRIAGGNLSIIHNLQATPFELKTSDSILFIEDIGEQLYHLDRMMQNLLLSGKLESLNGLIVGAFTEMKDKQRSFGKTPYEIVMESVNQFNFPVVFDFPSGHIENNHPFLLGAGVEIKVDEKSTDLIYV